MIQDVLYFMIDNMLLSFISIVNTGRNLCDKFINKSTFNIQSITLYLDNDQQYPLDIKSTNFSYNNIEEWIANYHIDVVLDKVDYWVEIVYYYCEKRYRILYNKWNHIHFPPYTLEELKPVVPPSFKLEIIYAENDQQDITDLLKEYAGPFKNFYHDKGYDIIVHKIAKGSEIIITDNNGDDYSFKANDVLCLKN